MPLYLLMINKRKWDRLNVPWLKPNQIQADPLGDLRINEGALSVWHIEDDESNLDLVIAALVATRQNFDKFEYGLFDQEIVTGFDGLEKHRLYDDEVQSRILDAIRTGHIDLQKLNKSLRHKITQLPVS